jgi:hypothetical protein
LLCGVRFPLARCAVINDPFQLPRMIAWIFRRTPNARDTKFTAAAFDIVIGAIQFAPGMTATHFDAPAVGFRMSNGFFNVFLWMSNSTQAACAPEY